MTQPSSSRVVFHALGRVSVTRAEGDATAPLLTQPRRLAVLAYLVLARPRGLHSRDTIVARLWPEADQASARHALRNALHGIRQALGDVIVTAGDDQVGVDRDRVSCDAIALEADLAAARFAEAIARYDGELLDGFHVADAPEFERWLDAERSRLHESVFRAAVALAQESRESGDVDGALVAARRASTLAPNDEVSLRRLMEILSMKGDRAGALREYDRFVARTRDEYGAQPGSETLELMRSLRAQAAPPTRQRESVRPEAPLETREVVAADTANVAAELADVAPPLERQRSWRRSRAVAGGVAALAAIMLTIVGWRERVTEARSSPASAHDRPNDLASRLPERYRLDTTLLRRYLTAEADREALRLKPARQSFQQLVDESPLYAPAWAGLSFTLYQSAFNDIPPSDALPRAVAAANRALAMDSTLAEAQSTLIANAIFGRWDLADAKRRLDLALAHHPDDPELNNLLATWHRWRGELDEAARLKQRALAIDPLSPRFARQIGSSLYFSHRCREAAEVFRRMTEERRENSYVGLTLFRSLKCLGEMDQAAIALRVYLIENGDTTLAKLLDPPLPPPRRDSALRAVFHARLDRHFAERQRRWRSSTEAMVQYADMENRDSTLVWLDSMYVERAMMLHVVPFDPMMDFLRDDPRFREFLRRLPWLPHRRRE